MQHHAVADRVAADVARRDPQRLGAILTETARLRALLPGGPIEARGREHVAALLCALLDDFDTVDVVESAGEPVADRLLIHYRLRLRQATAHWVCTQTAVCRIVDGRLAAIDLLCSGFREIEDGLSGEPDPAGGGHRLAAGPGVELAQDGRHVVVGGPARDDQPGGDLGVAQPVGQQAQHVELPLGEPGRVGAGGG